MVKSDRPVGPFVEGKRTARLRPKHGFSPVQVDEIRKQKKEGLASQEIAENLGADIHNVELALAALRTRRHNPDRYTINVGVSAGNFIKSEKRPGEAAWQTMDRILTELQEHRAKRKK